MSAKIAPRVRPLMVCWITSSDQCMRALIAAIAEAGAVVHWVRPTRILFAKRIRVDCKARHIRTWELLPRSRPDLGPIDWPLRQMRFPLERERAHFQPVPSPAHYFRTSTNSNLQPTGVSALTTLKPDMTSMVVSPLA